MRFDPIANGLNLAAAVEDRFEIAQRHVPLRGAGGRSQRLVQELQGRLKSDQESTKLPFLDAEIVDRFRGNLCR
jgi:hypothetical protein